MKTLQELEARIAEHFQQEEAPHKPNPAVRVYALVNRPYSPDAEEQLVQKMWDDVFAPHVGKSATILWRRHLGFQRTIPDGMCLSCRMELRA